jgi:hypothetical protein
MDEGTSRLRSGKTIMEICKQEDASISPEKAAACPLGAFHIASGKAIVSDPCYEVDPTAAVAVQSGEYTALISKKHLPDWGERVSELQVILTSKLDQPRSWRLNQDPLIGVDSGQAGIFDAHYYRDDTAVTAEDFGPVDWKCNGPFYSACGSHTLSDQRAGVLRFGVVAASGLGDGIYRVYKLKDDQGVYGFRIVFIKDSDQEDEQMEDNVSAEGSLATPTGSSDPADDDAHTSQRFQPGDRARPTIEEVAGRAGLTPAQVIDTLTHTLLEAALADWGASRQFEALWNKESSTIDLFEIVHIVDGERPASAGELSAAAAAAAGVEGDPGDELLFQLFYHDEQAAMARDQCQQYPWIVPFALLAPGLRLPAGAPSWLNDLWPRRRQPWQ